MHFKVKKTPRCHNVGNGENGMKRNEGLFLGYALLTQRQIGYRHGQEDG